MKTGPLVSLGLSVVLGIGALLIGRGYMAANSADATAQPVGLQAASTIAMSTVIVAADDILPGTALTKDMFKTVAWPESAVVAGQLTELPDADTQYYTRGLIVSGEPIMQAKLEEEGLRMTLSAEIEPGHRAISIVVKDDTGVAGFVLPGDRVDVNAFLPVASSEMREVSSPDSIRMGADIYAKPVLKGIKVLAVDQTFESNLEGALPSNTVTLEVTPAEALTLGVAAQSGQLGLTLIGQKEKGQEFAEIQVAPKPKPVRRYTAKSPARARKKTVRVINGNEETKVSAPVVADKMTSKEAKQ